MIEDAGLAKSLALWSLACERANETNDPKDWENADDLAHQVCWRLEELIEND